MKKLFHPQMHNIYLKRNTSLLDPKLGSQLFSHLANILMFFAHIHNICKKEKNGKTWAPHKAQNGVVE